jgi:predicted nucleic-acid-binding protein
VALLGLDTNVVLRWLMEAPDNDAQAEAAIMTVEAAEKVQINLIVLAELLWLSGQKARIDRAGQAAVVRGLLENPGVVVSDADSVAKALTAFEAGGAGFVDHLIGILNARAGCATTLTFDKTAAKTEHFTLLT